MRFMMLLKADKRTEAGVLPTARELEVMGKYNEELIKAGVLLDGAGLQPSSKGAKITFENGTTRVIDGPFAETKELLAGYWIIRVKSKEEAIEWASRCPAADNETIEVRQVHEFAEFPPDVQEAAAGFPELTGQPGRVAGS